MSRLPIPTQANRQSSDSSYAFNLLSRFSPQTRDVSHVACNWTSKNGVLKMGGYQKTLDTLEQDLLTEREKDVARLQGTLRRERENIRRLQSRCSQQAWELKRQEQQICRLKEKLTQLLDKNGDRKASMELLNTIPRSLGKKPLSRSIKAEERRREEAALRVMLERQEAELKQTSVLRHDLSALLHSLRAHMEQTLQETLMDVGDGTDCKNLLHSEEKLGDHVTGGVIQMWSRVQKRLGELASQGILSSSAGTDQEKLLAQMESDLEHSKQLIQLQQRLLQDSVLQPLPPDLIDSYYLEDWDRLQAKWEELESQRRCFQRERQAFTDAAIRLGWERQQFEQQKAAQARQQFLCQSPFSQSSGSRRESGSTSNMTYSSCHAATPLSQESGLLPLVDVCSPSTPELYSALRLSFGPRRSKGNPSCLEHWDQYAERPADQIRNIEQSF